MAEFAVPVVGAMIFNPQNELFLMQSSGKFGDEWIIPGGKVNFGEGMEAALRREIKEETNITLSEIRFLGVREMITDKKHFIFLEYAGWSYGNDEVVLNYESLEYKWCGPGELSKLKIAGPTKSLIDERLEILNGTFRVK